MRSRDIVDWVSLSIPVYCSPFCCMGQKRGHRSKMTRNVCRRFMWRHSVAFCKSVATILLPVIPSESRQNLLTFHWSQLIADMPFWAAPSVFLKKHRLIPCYSMLSTSQKWKSPCSRLEESTRSTTEDRATSHRRSGLWHWRDLVASPWSFCMEITTTTLTGCVQQWVSGIREPMCKKEATSIPSEISG